MFLRSANLRFGNSRFGNLKTAAIVLFGVVVLFFFPAPRGSFVSTHGPVTSLSSHCEGLAALLSLALTPWRRKLIPALVRLDHWPCTATPHIAHRFSPGFSILRI